MIFPKRRSGESPRNSTCDGRLFVRKKGSHESKWLWNELVAKCVTHVRDAKSMHLYDTARVGSRERS